MTVTAYFYRFARMGEIGPQLETKTIIANSKTDAIKTAKNIANQENWRFLEIREVSIEQNHN